MSNKHNAISAIIRSQTPQPPFPYTEELVSFPSTDTVTIAGSLTIPQGDGPFPAVILIAGMGPHDRDYTMMGHKLFLVIADHLTKNGIAVLRYDKRGIGKSTGSFGLTVTGKELIDDVLAGITYLQTRTDIDQKKIGLLGHSEGGALALKGAHQSSKIAFIVALAPAVGTSVEHVLTQVALQLTADGAPEHIIQIDQNIRHTLMSIALQEDPSTAQQKMRSYANSIFEQISPEDKDLLEQYPFAIKQSSFDSTITMLNSPAYRYILQQDSQILPIQKPILALNGSLDFITVSSINLAIIRNALHNNIQTHSCIQEIDHANHWFQTGKTGALAEYGALEETIQPAILTLITQWISKQ